MAVKIANVVPGAPLFSIFYINDLRRDQFIVLMNGSLKKFCKVKLGYNKTFCSRIQPKKFLVPSVRTFRGIRTLVKNQCTSESVL